MLWSTLVRAFSLLLFSQVVLSAVTFTNPIKNPDGSDPFMVYDGGYYYLLTTTWTNLQITRATTVAGLKTATPKVVYTDSNSARCCNVWAPEIHKVGWIHSSTRQLKATNAPDAWSIDGTVLTVSGTNYFVFSSFSPNNLQSLYIAPMTNAYTLGARSLLSEPLNSWERVDTPVNEGPVALYKNGAIYLAFSASFCWTSSYSLGLLKYNGGTVTSASSWTKTGPVFTSANGHYGPGHNGFFTAPDGQTTYLVYHATSNPNGACDGTRYTLVQPLYFHTDGVTPIWGVPRALSDSIPEPPTSAATTTTTKTTTTTTKTTTT
ncbi:glycoside hydrolase family 43 protein [Tulasnella calospora MUT 4182]|uniref:Glycoside hydrolase family 43 protein n=1 Tax=Tulasnella calospora MUT 4182 TaxID=1051891 RepID=A0A0C3QDH7_9AGAM|nr:glycoside hydrolase family 43 protein [Tulasnella calospora MUT 4182]